MEKFKNLNLEAKIEILVMFVVLGLLVLKFSSPFLYKSLWAEDGIIFLQQAHGGFFNSLFTAYAGYIHLIPRLCAGFSLLFDLKYTPIIFLIPPVLAVLALVHTVFKSFDVSLWKKSLISFLIVLTPVDITVFNNLTNMQWILCSMLIIFVVSERKISSKFEQYLLSFVVLLIGLTGPFSLLLLPVLFLRLFIRKDFKRNLYFYLPFLISAIIQIFVLANSQRVVGNVNTVLSSSQIFQAISNVFLHISVAPFVSIIIFVWMVYLFVRNFRLENKNYEVPMMLISGFIITFSAILLNTNPLAWSVCNGCRYTYNLYFCIFASMVLLTQIKREAVFTGVLILAILVGGVFGGVSDINWDSAVLLYKALPEIQIAINPDKWSLHLENKDASTYKNPNVILKLTSGVQPIKIKFDGKKYCPASSDFGLVLSTSTEDGEPNVLIFRNESYVYEKVLYPYFLGGNYKFFYAAPTEKDKAVFWLEFLRVPKPRNYKAEIYCLNR